jgi:hypothetical protein
MAPSKQTTSFSCKKIRSFLFSHSLDNGDLENPRYRIFVLKPPQILVRILGREKKVLWNQRFMMNFLIYLLAYSNVGPSLRAISFFFPSGMADVALWLGPYMSINCQNYICTRTQKVHKCRQIKSHQTTHKTHNQDDPQIPQPDLRFVKKTANQTDKGARAQTTKPTKRICQGTQRTLPLCHTQKHA